jgi:hypothetical protein
MTIVRTVLAVLVAPFAIWMRSKNLRPSFRHWVAD